MLRSRRLPAVLLLAVLTLNACGDGTDGVEVLDARSRMSPMLTGVGAVYLDIENGTEQDDQLLSASVDPGVADRVELHETFDTDTAAAGMDADGMEDSTDPEDAGTAPDPDGAAMMGMRELDALEVPAGETVSLVPGGYHLMLLELADDLEPGGTFELTLRFATAGEVDVTVEVREDV